MSAENADVNKTKSEPSEKRSQARTWIWIIVSVILFMAAYEIVTHWENFTRGLSGKPELTE